MSVVSEAQSYVDKLLSKKKGNEEYLDVPGSYRSNYESSSIRFTESQILSKTEIVTEKIANILITNNWSVSSVFGHPDII